MKQLYTFLVIAILCICKPNYSTAQVNVNDSLALVDLYNSTDGAHWINHTNWLTGAVSTWYGIVTNSGRVTEINIQYNNLTGILPSSLGNLKNLSTLNLQSNYISGIIPASMGKLKLLTSLTLSYNSFAGSIPFSFGNLINLQILELDNNLLTGNVPTSFSNLINLTAIGLSFNKLTGPITFLSNLKKLYGIWLSHNQFSGSIPPFENNSPTYYLDIELDDNQLTGSLPNISHIEWVSEFYVDHNKLTGIIPSSYSNIKASFNFSYNELSGVIPAWFSNLNPYQIAIIQNNHFNFDSLEYIVANYTNYNFIYSPQLNIPITYTPQAAFGKLSVHAGGTLSNNTYQWYKNNSLYRIIVGDSTFIPDAEGTYFVKVNNSIVTNLQLVSDTINIVAACSSPPSNTGTKNIQSTSATITWNASQGAISYQVKYKVAGTSTFTTINTANTSVTLTGLTANTKYIWKVRAKCSLAFSGFTLLKHFQTLPAFASISQSNDEIQKPNNFILYPNPASNNLNIMFNASSQSSYTITIYDLQGRLLLNKTGIANSGNDNFTLDIHALTPGMYFVKIYCDNKTTVKKLVKE